MTNPENASEYSPEQQGGITMDQLRREAEAERDALNQGEPIKVNNQVCVFWWRNWAYVGDWNPWKSRPCWKWKFIGGDLVLDWNWTRFWLFQEGNMTLGSKKYKIDNCFYPKGKSKDILRGLKWTWYCDIRWKETSYKCELDENFRLEDFEYRGVKLHIVYKNWTPYLQNSAGRKLKFWSVDTDVACVRIAASIAIVQNAIKTGQKSWLDYFEKHWIELQADYLGTWRDTTLLSNCFYSTWISPDDLSDWLNASRTDFWV